MYHGYDGKAGVSKISGQTEHLLLSVRGCEWKKVNLVLFTLYIDDSGTDPRQHVAIATALVIPAAQINRLQNEWDRFSRKEKFATFHTSEFAARNPKKEPIFAEWDNIKQAQIFGRVREFCKKYGSRAISVAVNKADYDEVVTGDIRAFLGQTHYGWAVRQLILHINVLFPPSSNPREFVFQWIERHEPSRREIENIMDQMQFFAERSGDPADYGDPHFRKSVGMPGLQCADAVSWISYQYAIHLYKKSPLHRLVPESWEHFEGPKSLDGWLRAVAIRKKNLVTSIEQANSTPNVFKFYDEWKQHRALSRQNQS